MESADFCPFCMSPLKEKIPISFKQNRLMKKLIIPCIALILAVTVALLTVGNIKPNGNSSFVSSGVSDNVDENTVTEPSLNEENNGPDNSGLENTQNPDNTSSNTTTTPQPPSDNDGTSNNGGNNGENTGGNNSTDSSNTGSTSSGTDGNTSGNNSGSSNTGSTSSGTSSGTGGNTNGNSGSSGTTTPTGPVTINGIKYSFQQVTDSTHGGQPYTAAVVTGYTSDIPANVVIPSTVEGYPVAKIGVKAFDNCGKIISLTISDGVTIIEDYAFQHCSNIKTISFSNTLEQVGWESFQYCRGMTSLYLPQSLKKIGHGTFSDCTSLTLVETYATYLDMGAFNGCTALKTVKFKNTQSRLSVGDSAFSKCTALKDVYCYFKKEQCGFDYSNECLKEATWHLLT